MTPARHPSPRVLSAYAKGELRPAFVIAAGVHLRACADCSEQVRRLEAEAGAVLAAESPAPMPNDLFDRLRARLSEPGPPPAPAIRFGRKRWGARGLWVRHAPPEVRGADQLFLLNVGKGCSIPHGHAGQEFVAMLRGSFDDETGSYRAGDFLEMSSGTDHTPRAGPQGCLCVVAGERRMRMNTLAGRLAQLLTGA